jgi:hypothetical protein
VERRLPQPAPLVLELGHPRLQLVGHLVEGVRQGRELVAASDVHAVTEPASGDPSRGIGEAAEGSDYRAALDVRDGCDQHQRREHRKEEPGAKPADGLVDPRLRREHNEGNVPRAGEPVRGERAEAPPGDLDLGRLGRHPDRPANGC